MGEDRLEIKKSIEGIIDATRILSWGDKIHFTMKCNGVTRNGGCTGGVGVGLSENYLVWAVHQFVGENSRQVLDLAKSIALSDLSDISNMADRLLSKQEDTDGEEGQ